MSTVLSEKMHAYEAAKAAGRVPYKVPISAWPSGAARSSVWPKAKCPA